MSSNNAAAASAIRVMLPATGKLKYSAGGHVFRAFDFDISPEKVAIERVDLNSFWLCCGKNPEERFCGAWLLAPGSRVVAYIGEPGKTTFNHEQHKTYMRLWFVTSRESMVDLRALPPLTVRIAFAGRQGRSDTYLTVCGEGELYDFENREIDSRVFEWGWRASKHGFNGVGRWAPLPPPNIVRAQLESERAARRVRGGGNYFQHQLPPPRRQPPPPPPQQPTMAEAPHMYHQQPISYEPPISTTPPPADEYDPLRPEIGYGRQLVTYDTGLSPDEEHRVVNQIDNPME